MSLRSSRCDTLGRAVRRNCRSCASVKQTATILLERGGECTFFLPTAWARPLNSGHLHEACAKNPEARVFAPFGVLLRRPTRRPPPDVPPLSPIALRALRRPSAGSEPSAVARLSIGRGEPVACGERGCAEASVARCIIGGSKGSPPAHARRSLSGGGSAGPFGKGRPCA